MQKTLLIIGILVMLVFIIAAGTVAYIRSSLPKIAGEVRVDGLDGQIEIVRDEYGIPHIFAATDHDAHFALGYVHAQDRLWQLEIQRRIGAGRLSEIFGEATVNTDKFLRTLGTYRAAEATWDDLSAPSQMALQAYTDGINAWLTEKNVLPPEFIILQVKPEPWTVYDSLVWAKMMAWDLGSNYDTELLRMELVAALGEERAGELLPFYPDDGILILDDTEWMIQTTNTLLEIDDQLQTKFQLGGLDVGSNNWVIGGDLTETGLPIVANDPHLGAGIPSVWYLVEMQGSDLHVTGASFPGLPSVVIGHNKDIAWGVTNVNPDVQDIYIERINPANPDQYEVNGEWVDMDIVEEIIIVKDQDDPIKWSARSTRHGPLISDVSGDTTMPMAMRWTALEAGDTTMNAYTEISYAKNWGDFVNGLESYVAPSQNFVFADREGNFGYYAPGKIPVRAKGEGLVPVPGWQDDYEWIDWIPFAELPHSYNPEKGYIVTANNKVVSDSYPYFINHEWATPHRAARITEMIEAHRDAGTKITTTDVETMQADQDSIQSRDLLPYLLAIEPQTEQESQALTYLRDWDQVASVDSVATSIYQAWYRHLGPVIFEDDLNHQLLTKMSNRVHATFLNEVLETGDDTWCDNHLDFEQQTCTDMVKLAFELALDDLETRIGPRMDQWEWGKIHRTQYPHNPFSEVETLKPYFHREIANGGDKDTVNVAPTRYANEENPYFQYHVPSYRHVVDMSNFADSVFMTTTGQSGNILSTHYDDFISPHQQIEYVPMSFGRDTVSGNSLILQPK